MAFDEGGIWHPDISIYPGTSGGANAGLDFLNAFKSQSNANVAQQRGDIETLLKYLASQNAGAIADNPQAAASVHMTPDQFQQTYSNTPMGKLRQFGTDNPDATQDDIYQFETTQGMIPPTALSANVRAGNIDRNKLQRELLSLDEKGRKVVADLVKTYDKQGYDDPVEAAMASFHTIKGTGAAPTVPGAITPDASTSSPTPVGTLPGQSPVAKAGIASTEAQATERKARAGKEGAETTFINTKTQWMPLVWASVANKNYASGAHFDALTAATDLATDIKQQEAEGALTPQLRQSMTQHTEVLAAKLANLLKDPKTRQQLGKKDQNAKDLQATIDGLKQAVADGRSRVGGAPAVTLKKKEGAAEPAKAASATPHYANLDEFKADFQKTRGVPPTAAQIANAASLGWIGE